MRPETSIVLLWLLFAVSHTVPSTASLRPKLVEKLGAGPFMGLYSLLSFAFFIPLVVVYFRNRHAGEMLYGANPQLRSLAFGIAFVGMALTVAAVVRPSPVSMAAGTPSAGSQRGFPGSLGTRCFSPPGCSGSRTFCCSATPATLRFSVAWCCIRCSGRCTRTIANDGLGRSCERCSSPPLGFLSGRL